MDKTNEEMLEQLVADGEVLADAGEKFTPLLVAYNDLSKENTGIMRKFIEDENSGLKDKMLKILARLEKVEEILLN